MKLTSGLVVLTLLVAAAAPAAAEDSACGLGDLMGFYNLITIEDLDTDSDVQGRTFVGGDIGTAAFEIGSRLQNVIPEDEFGLEVVGNVPSGGDIKVLGGSMLVNDQQSIAGSVTQWTVNGRKIEIAAGNQGGSVEDATVASLVAKKNQIERDLKDLSSDYCALEATAANTFVDGTFTVNAKEDDGTSVFYLNATTVFEVQNQNMQLNNAANADFIVINLFGSSSITASTSINMNIGSQFFDSILWNFCDATDIDLQALGFRGALLAPYADVRHRGGNIDGSMAVKSLDTTTEVHVPLLDGICPTVEDGEMVGDPHIKSWKGVWYDYHGECDLKLVHVPKFDGRLDLDIHARTTIHLDFSYIEAAAVRIGDDVLEVGSWGLYSINGVEDALADGVEAPQYTGTTTGLDQIDGTQIDITIGGFPMYYRYANRKRSQHIFDIVIGRNSNITITNYKYMVGVNVKNAKARHFRNVEGILGNYHGEMLGRDGKTDLKDDIIALGEEWQIRPEQDGMLFQSHRSPQYPEHCNYPINSLQEERKARHLENGARIDDVTVLNDLGSASDSGSY